MPPSHSIRIAVAAVLGGILFPASMPACNVPVFRYALEQWSPDPYVAVVFHRDALSQTEQGRIEGLERIAKEGQANFLVLSVDLSKPMSAALRALWNSQAHPELPWLVLRYPAQTGIESPVWAGPLRADDVASFADSPGRREITRRLLRGDTAIWLLLESGDKAQDDAVAQAVDTQSHTLERTLTLPGPLADDPPLNAGLPLRIAFSTVRIARSDPAERLLVAELVSWDPGVKATDKPLLFPVFGRGRVLPPALGTAARPEILEGMARLLTGPCSCQIKEMNAGFDLLLTADWEKLFDGRSPAPPQPAALTSLSQFAADATNRPNGQARVGSPGPATQPSAAVPARPGPLLRNLLAGLAVGVVVLGVATLVMRANGKTRR